ncbi:MAG: sulfatase, partial [Myxococcota bacterium]|nr:sulfatase [Myxococcota bacterium]
MSSPSLAPTLAILGLVLAVFVGCGRPEDPAQRVPAERIVLITIDTLRADFVSAYGEANADTPSLDSLSETGVRFSTAISPTPLTLPTHATILTGLDPPHHGVRDNTTFALPEDLVTLPEILARSGWATGAFVGSFILDRQHGLDRGFDRYDDAMGVQGERRVYGIPERSAEQVVDTALDWLQDAPDRFFLWVHFFDPHTPWEGPESAAPRARYAAEIERTDRQVG